MKDNMKIVFFGAGAVGQSVGGWIASHYDNIFFLDQGKVAETMKEKGVTLYRKGDEDKKEHVRLNVINNINEIADADVIVVSVKNFSLDSVSKIISDTAGDKPVIIGMQNGVENQSILPKYFSKVIYCVLGYNAWFDEPGVIGYQQKGPLVFGTTDNRLQNEMKEIADIFNKGVETIIVDHLQDAAHSKMIINLTNSITTLTGHGFTPISDQGIFQTLFTNLLYEGVLIVKAMGYKECKIGGMPPWRKIRMGAKLPQILTRRMFNKNTKKMVLCSMAQDIIQRGGHDSELETINGYFIKMADKYNLKVPYNRAIYDLCREQFAKEKFEPLDVKVIMDEVNRRM